MTYIKYTKLVLLNAVSAAIHTDTHFGATKNVLLEAAYHPDMWDTKYWAVQQKLGRATIFYFCTSAKRGPFLTMMLQTLANMTYKIHTLLGISEES